MLHYARQLAKSGIEIKTQVLTWRHGQTPFGATHCMELPLIFGSWQTWKEAPFLRGVTPEAHAQQAETAKEKIDAFV